MANRNVIVTGATGFVGRHVVRYLVDSGYHIIAIGCNRIRRRSRLIGLSLSSLYA